MGNYLQFPNSMFANKSSIRSINSRARHVTDINTRKPVRHGVMVDRITFHMKKHVLTPEPQLLYPVNNEYSFQLLEDHERQR